MASILDMRVKLYSTVDAVAHGDPDWEGTLNEFWEANQDSFVWGDITAIGHTLNERGKYCEGGGAAAEFMLVKVVPPTFRERFEAAVRSVPDA